MRTFNPTRITRFRVSQKLLRSAAAAALSTQSDSTVPKVQNFINGQFVDSKTTKWIPVYNPGTTMTISYITVSCGQHLAVRHVR